MDILQSMLAAIKSTEVCTVSVANGQVSVFAQTPKYSVNFSVCMPSEGTDTPSLYFTQHLILSSKNAQKVEEKNLSLIFSLVNPCFSAANTVQPHNMRPPMLLPLSVYTAKVSLKVSVFKKMLSMLNASEVNLYLLSDALYLCSSTPEGDKKMKITAVTILQESSSKICIPFSSLRISLPLLSFCESVILMYDKNQFSLIPVFKKDRGSCNIIINRISAYSSYK